MKIQSLLSIDFDYIMNPCINLYNQYSHGDGNPTIIWERLFQDLDLKDHLSYDAKALKDISMIMTRSVLGGAKFVAIDSNEKIVDDLKKSKDYEESIYDIINIDFHHDIIYNRDDLADIFNRGDYTCANWAMYLMVNDKINVYTWVKAPNSKLFDESIIKDALNENYLDKHVNILRQRDIKKIYIPFDKVYLCKSEQWVPYQYIHLYDTLCSMLTEIDKTIVRKDEPIKTLTESLDSKEDRGDENE